MKLSPKNRLLAVLLAVVLFIVLSYQMAIKPTVEVRTHYKQLVSKINLSKNLPEELSFLTNKETYLDSVLSELTQGSSSIQNNLLRFLQEQSRENAIRISEFSKPHVVEQEDYHIATYQFKLKGGYTALLKTLYALEQKGIFGEVVHVNYQKKKNYRTRKEHLEATVFVQQLK